MRAHRIAALLLALCLLPGCGAATEQPAQAEPLPAATAQPAEPQVQPAPGPSEKAEQAGAADVSHVADASQMTAVEEVVEPGMTPVHADELRDGAYPVAVKSSSSMFKIADCALTVANGAMTAALTMSSDAYGYLFAGTAEAAAAADASAYIEPEGRTFVLPVEALDAGVACAAWSRNKELWYDRTLVFRADSLPLEAFRTLVTAESLGLADGQYTVEAALTGGSGRASVQSPAKLTVEGGKAAAEIVWSSPNYDYMKVDGEQIAAEIVDGHSVCVIPVAVFDRPLAVVADTTAMSKPHEIEYSLTFDSATIKAAEP